MKNKFYILAFILLALASVAIAVFVKKQTGKKEEKEETHDHQEDLEVSTEKPIETSPRQLDRPLQALNVESNISIDVNTENRSFAYNMHYNGIAIDGKFEDGNEDLIVQKSFGSFHIVQRGAHAKLIDPNVSQKTGAYTKVGATIIDINTSKPIAHISNSDFVDLTIKDKEGQIIRSLSVNLLTGAQIGSIAPPQWDGD